MDNFDKNLHDKLNEINEQDFEFKPAAWERFQAQRAKPSADKKGGFYNWLNRNLAAAAIILLLLISNIFFAHQSVSTRYEVQKLSKRFEKLTTSFEKNQLQNEVEQSQKLTQLESLKTNLEISNRTITALEKSNQIVAEALQTERLAMQNYSNNNSKSVDFQNENEIQTQTIERSIFNTDDFIANTKIPQLLNDQIDDSKSRIDKIIANDYNNSNQAAIPNSNLITGNMAIEGIVNKINNLAYLEKQLLNLESTSSLDLGKLPENVNTKKALSLNDKLILFGQKAKPTKHQIGWNINVDFIPVTNGIQPVNNLQTGINASSLFFDRIRINTGLNVWTQIYNYEDLTDFSDEISTEITTNFPNKTPNNPQDDLNKIEGEIMGFSIPLNAQILLGKKEAKWQPYLGFGIVGRYFNNYNFEYYYSDYNNSDNTYENKVLGQIKQFDFSLWTSNIGIAYRLSARFEIDAAFNFSKSNTIQPVGISNLEQFGASLNLKYNF